ncbi:MAG TPA: hypothetical protein VFS71_15525 [Flavobacterium sp.]|uniref:hypothetical protein n=1 Tax=Flavobacterium sp. TaxID=239 RepID=UPI002DB8419B|nr:hypothetical protein [Flavobacterium sp.]HEU4791097.1 hypothetical protein [Flavobacterium sp.]
MSSNLTSLETSQGVVRIIMQRVTNLPPINGCTDKKGGSSFAANKLFPIADAAIKPADANTVFLIKSRLSILKTILLLE